MAYTTIDDPSAHFHTRLFQGDGSSGLTVTNNANAGDFKPDWLWIKNRAGTYATRSHELMDSNRGANKALEADDTEAEFTRSGTNSFNTNGFTVGDDYGVNPPSGTTSVAWQWKANGGTTSSNSDGTITSTVQANTTAGFSIITYTGNFTDNQTIGHGLSQAPEALIIKNRDHTSGTSWVIYHEGLNFPTKDLIYFNTNAANDHDPTFNNTAPSSSVITMGAYSFNNRSGDSHVCYAFHSVKGYSKFGKYTGNITSGSDGAFVYTGFKPAWLMVKSDSNAGQEWVIFDNKRDSFNQMDAWLYANASTAEDSTGDARDVDFLSNGFKFRNAGGPTSYSGRTYIYFAFAEHPFVSSKGVPVTAR